MKTKHNITHAFILIGLFAGANAFGTTTFITNSTSTVFSGSAINNTQDYYIMDGVNSIFGVYGNAKNRTDVNSSGFLTIKAQDVENNGWITFQGDGTNNNATVGGVIANYGGTIDISNVIFSNNKATLGGGIYNTGTATITNVKFLSNFATNGGGIYNGAGAVAYISDSVFDANRATDGSAISNSGTAALENVTITNHQGFEAVANYGDFSMTGGTIGSNKAGIVSRGNISMTGVTVQGNTVGIQSYGDENTVLTFTDVDFSNNSSGAIQSSGGTVNINTTSDRNYSGNGTFLNVTGVPIYDETGMDIIGYERATVNFNVASGTTLTLGSENSNKDSISGIFGAEGYETMINKNGSGTLQINGTQNFYGFDGIYNVQEGNLLLGNQKAGLSASQVVVGNATQFGGLGTVYAAVEVNNGGVLQAGFIDNGGVLTVGSLTINDGLKMNAGSVIELTLASDGSHSVLNLLGDVSFDANQKFQLLDSDFSFLNDGGSYYEFNGIITGLIADPGITDGWILDGLSDYGLVASFVYDQGNINLLIGNTPPIPEPSTYAVLFGVMSLAFTASRRKRKE